MNCSSQLDDADTASRYESGRERTASVSAYSSIASSASSRILWTADFESVNPQQLVVEKISSTTSLAGSFLAYHLIKFVRLDFPLPKGPTRPTLSNRWSAKPLASRLATGDRSYMSSDGDRIGCSF